MTNFITCNINELRSFTRSPRDHGHEFPIPLLINVPIFVTPGTGPDIENNWFCY